MGLAELLEEHVTTSVTDTEQPKLINLPRVKQIGIGVNKMDYDIADSKQKKFDEISNESKSVSTKNCARTGHLATDFIVESTHNPPKLCTESDRVSWK